MKKLILCAMSFYCLYSPAKAQETELMAAGLEAPATAVRVEKQPALNVYPKVQQADQPVFIETKEGLLESGEIILLDQSGRVVREINLKGGVNKVALYLYDFGAGQYTLLIRSGNIRTSEKIEFR